MARKKNATEIKEPDEYRGLVRLAMLDFRGRHQRKPHDFEEFWEWCHRYGSDELFREAGFTIEATWIFTLGQVGQRLGEKRYQPFAGVRLRPEPFADRHTANPTAIPPIRAWRGRMRPLGGMTR